MSDRIKIGDAVFELPAGAPPRVTAISAGRGEAAVALDPVAFTASEPDLLAHYMSTTVGTPEPVAAAPAQEAELTEMTAWRAFAGETSHLPEQWEWFAQGRQRLCGFNGWAFLYGSYWFIYQRMLVQGVLAFIVEVGMLDLAYAHGYALIEYAGGGDAGRTRAACGLSLVALTARLFMAWWANVALYRKANKEIAAVRQVRLDTKRKLAVIAAAGAGSMGWVAVFSAAIIALRIFIVLFIS
ncbi:MAG: DUF2628 domain-containing protein [Massilia sp.]